MTVFVVQDCRDKDVRPAMKFGNLKTLSSYQGTVTHDVQKRVPEMKENLAGITDKDYILPVGDVALIAIACSLAALMNNGRVNILKWDNNAKEYYPISYKSTEILIQA